MKINPIRATKNGKVMVVLTENISARERGGLLLDFERYLKDIIDRTYTADIFGSDDIVPVRKLEDNLYILGLSNGPTLAFKDVAMQFLGNAFEYVLKRKGARISTGFYHSASMYRSYFLMMGK